jgi:type I restriction enzyme S subunit
MRLPCYERYADTKLPWAPKLPAHWQVLRNGRLFSQRVETGFPDLPILEVSLNTGVRVRDLANSKRKQVMSDKEKYKRALKGDIAYNMMRMWQGAVGIAPVDGLISPAYVVAKPFAETNSSYYSYLFRTADYKDEVNKYSRGIVSDRNRLYWDEFKQMPSIVPPRGEQDQIVAYLRVQDAHIARFIKAKRELIGLLNEQKQTLIHQAVTKGVDPNVVLKPSDIDWLGGIPEHWTTRRLKFLADNISEQTDAQQVDEVYLALEHVESWNGNFNPLKEHISFASTVKRFKKNDVLFGKLRPYLAKVVQALQNGVCVSEFIVIRPKNKRISSDFLEILLRSKEFIELVNSSTVGAKMPRADWAFIGNVRIPLPEPDEQARLVKAIRNETQSIDVVIDRIKREIELVIEYRERLITDAVTGQIDLRNWQPGPDDNFDDNDLSALSEGDESTDEEDEDESD